MKTEGLPNISKTVLLLFFLQSQHEDAIIHCDVVLYTKVFVELRILSQQISLNMKDYREQVILVGGKLVYL